MLKQSINKFLRNWNVELHGVNYIHSLQKRASVKNEFDYFKSVIKKKDPVIFDVGANRGLMIDKFLACFHNCHLYAFEPIPVLFAELRKRFSENPAIQLNNLGVTSRGDERTFYINKGIDTSSLLLPKETGLNSDAAVKVVEEIRIPTTSLDTFTRSENIAEIDILKLDIQGGELDALKGGSDLLSKGNIKLIYLETYFIQQYEHQPLFFDVANFLLGYNYTFQDLYNPIYGDGRIAWCDSIFIRK